MSTSPRWEIRILGPLELARDGDEPRRVPRAKERALLAALALDAGRVVSTDALVDALWGEEPPASAANALQVHVSNARKLFDGDGHTVLRREPAGYALDAAVDLQQFEAAGTVLGLGILLGVVCWVLCRHCDDLIDRRRA